MDNEKIEQEAFYVFTIEEQDLERAKACKLAGGKQEGDSWRYYTPSCHCVAAEALARAFPGPIGWARSDGTIYGNLYQETLDPADRIDIRALPECAKQVHKLTILFDDGQYSAVREMLPLTVACALDGRPGIWR